MRRVQPPISREDREDLDRATWRVFTCTAGSSNKFWKIRSAGRWSETWWGRRGTNGQRKVKDHGSGARCLCGVRDLVLEKQGKGYVEHASEWDTRPVRDEMGNVVTRRAFAHPAPPTPTPTRLLETVGNKIAVYAQRDVYGTGPEGARLVHERGHRQLLLSALASEIVGGRRGDYGYWHPDSEPAARPTPLLSEGSAEEEARRLIESFGQTAESFQFLYQQEYPASFPPVNSGRGRSSWDVMIGVPEASFTDMDVSGFLGNEPWRVYERGISERWYIRRRGVYIEIADQEAPILVPTRRGRKFIAEHCARQAQDLYIQMSEEQGFRFLAMQAASIPLGDDLVRTEPARKWKTLGPNDRRLEAVAWHVLIKTDAVQKQVYWRIRYTGRLLETWSGGNRTGSERGVRAGRLYDFEADVLPDVYELILEKLRRGFFPPEHDDLVMCVVAGRDPDLWTVVQERTAVRMTRCTVALGRFSTIDEEEEIL